jgi:hypothetical protein
MPTRLLPPVVLLALAVPTPAAAAEPVGFAREVVPVLTRAGCNSGACHGTPAGKNGFRLSLRGYDPGPDHHALTRELGGRRIDRPDPDRSLLLLKATARVPHEGGRKLDPAGHEYRLVRDWIAQGAADDRDRSPRPKALRVDPPEALLDAPATTLRLRVTAAFPDGPGRDVTHLTRFTSSDEAVARVGPDGTVTKGKPGEAVVTAEYLGLMAPAVVLFRDPKPGYRWPDPPAANYVDRHVHAKLELLQVDPAPPCGDEVFVRRATLDATGRLPTPDAVRAFLADPDPGKRAKLIDDLLGRPEFADWWALKWSDRLGVNQRFVGVTGAAKYHRWVRGMMAANVPEDVFARAVLTAAGGNYATPPAGFYRRLRNPQDRAEEIAQLFLGVRVQCARCHNHPGENWTQDDYYGVAAFFARVKYRDGPFFNHLYDKEETVLTPHDGELAHPRTGAAVAPKFPGGPAADPGPGADRRGAFAAWLTSPDNPYFARAAANRVWFHLLGRGIVDPVDDFRGTNPPGVPALLDALAADLAAHRFDRKHLIRTVMNSRVYQASGRAAGPGDEDGRYFSRYVPRRLGAEALLDAIGDATGVADKFRGFPAGTRAVQLPDGEFPHPFLQAFGRPARASACECERAADTTLHTALLLQGGDFLQRKLADPAGRAARLAGSDRSDREVIEELFLATLSRRPTAAEADTLLAGFAARPGRTRRQNAEDALHALLNHPEFLFQH